MLFRRAGLKLLSVALAILMWLLVAGERIVERSLRVPLEFTNLPAELEMVGDPPTLVDVRLRGSSGALSRITAGDLVAMIDLAAARPGQRLLNVTGADVRVPFGVEVMQVSPSSLSMRFEPSASKVVPIVAAVEGEPADGFVITETTSSPATVEVVGPQTAVEALLEATTEPVSVADATASVTESVNVGVTEPTVRLRQPLAARVVVRVVPAPVEWAVAEVVVQVRNADLPLEVSPTHVTVHLRGPRSAMSYGAEAIGAWIDVSGLKRGRYQLPVEVSPPSGVGVSRVEPTEISVRIR